MKLAPAKATTPILKSRIRATFPRNVPKFEAEIRQLPAGKRYFCKLKCQTKAQPIDLQRVILILDNRQPQVDIMRLWVSIKTELENYKLIVRNFSFGKSTDDFPEIMHADSVAECFKNIIAAFWATAQKDVSFIFFTNGNFSDDETSSILKYIIELRLICKMFRSSEVHIIAQHDDINLNNLQVLRSIGYVEGLLLIINSEYLHKLGVNWWDIVHYLQYMFSHIRTTATITNKTNTWSRRIILMQKLHHMIARFSVPVGSWQSAPWVIKFDRDFASIAHKITDVRRVFNNSSEDEYNTSTDICEHLAAGNITLIKGQRDDDELVCNHLLIYEELKMFRVHQANHMQANINNIKRQCIKIIKIMNFPKLRDLHPTYRAVVDQLEKGACVGIPFKLSCLNGTLRILNASNILAVLNLSAKNVLNTPNYWVFPIYLFPEHWIIASKFLDICLRQLVQHDAYIIDSIPYILMADMISIYRKDSTESNRTIIKFLFETCQHITQENSYLCATFIRQKINIESFNTRVDINNIAPFIVQICSIPFQNYASLVKPTTIAYLVEELHRNIIKQHEESFDVHNSLLTHQYSILACMPRDHNLTDDDPLWDNLLFSELPDINKSSNHTHEWRVDTTIVEDIFHIIGLAINSPELINCKCVKLTKYQILAIILQNTIQHDDEIRRAGPYIDFIASSAEVAEKYLLDSINAQTKTKLSNYWKLRQANNTI